MQGEGLPFEPFTRSLPTDSGHEQPAAHEVRREAPSNDWGYSLCIVGGAPSDCKSNRPRIDIPQDVHSKLRLQDKLKDALVIIVIPVTGRGRDSDNTEGEGNGELSAVTLQIAGKKH